MTRKNDMGGLPAVIPPTRTFDRVMAGGGALVRVDAAYHVADVHPAGDGPWMGEADKIAWTDPATGYPCIIRREPRGGFLRGYVAVPPGHPLFGRHVGTLHAYDLGVHGGLDHSDGCEADEDEERSVCHVATAIAGHRSARVRTSVSVDAGTNVDPGSDRRDDAWWLGFSCDGRDDVVPEPRLGHHRPAPRVGVDEPTYKTERFVHLECVRLAAQLKAISEGRSPRDADPGPTRMELLALGDGR